MGDCCLMQVDNSGKGSGGRNVSLTEIFAIHDEPVSHRLQVEWGITERTDTNQQGQLRDGDMLLLATDAMAAWLLKRHEEGRPLWNWLYRKLGTLRALAAIVAYGRKNGLRNDDFTLVRVIHHDSRVERRRGSDACMARPD